MAGNKYYESVGMGLLRLYAGRREKANAKRRGVVETKKPMSASQILYKTLRGGERTMLFNGTINRALPFLDTVLRKCSRPVCIVGTSSAIPESSCLMDLGIQWTSDGTDGRIRDGIGLIRLSAARDPYLTLYEHLGEWNRTHYIILCAGKGLQIDGTILNKLNAGDYMIVTESVSQAVRNTGSNSIEAEELLRYINVLFILGCTDSARQLASVMPVYSYEKYTNGLDFSLHHDEPLKEAASRGHHHTGGGLSFGQKRTLEERNLFTEEDLRQLQKENKLVVCNLMYHDTFITHIC